MAHSCVGLVHIFERRRRPKRRGARGNLPPFPIPPLLTSLLSAVFLFVHYLETGVQLLHSYIMPSLCRLFLRSLHSADIYLRGANALAC